MKNLGESTTDTHFTLVRTYSSRTNVSFLIYYMTLPHCHVVVTTTAVPAGNYMFKVNNRNTRARCETCSELTIKAPDRRHWCCSGAFIVNFEHILHFVLVVLFLTLCR